MEDLALAAAQHLDFPAERNLHRLLLAPFCLISTIHIMILSTPDLNLLRTFCAARQRAAPLPPPATGRPGAKTAGTRWRASGYPSCPGSNDPLAAPGDAPRRGPGIVALSGASPGPTAAHASLEDSRIAVPPVPQLH